MPCTVDTSREDRAWMGERDRHHQVVEGLLEKVIAGIVTPADAAILLKQERMAFAKNFEEIFRGLCDEKWLADNVKNIIEGRKLR